VFGGISIATLLLSLYTAYQQSLLHSIQQVQVPQQVPPPVQQLVRPQKTQNVAVASHSDDGGRGISQRLMDFKNKSTSNMKNNNNNLLEKDKDSSSVQKKGTVVP
jgi:hypothetical protein